jgi:Zn-dependent peptidase ImmA (M78 family)
VAEDFKFKRGFKAESERKAELFRSVLSIEAHEPLPAALLAEHLGLKIFTAKEIFGQNCTSLRILSNSNEWSALTLPCKSGENIIIHNEYHSRLRQESNLMHELAHNICGHESPSHSRIDGLGLLMRIYKEEQEKEAEWLGGCLQLPRKALSWAILKRKMNENDISDYYTASIEMVRFRINTTGVMQQAKNWKNYTFKKF